MNYELAKQLKGAGFPQSSDHRYVEVGLETPTWVVQYRPDTDVFKDQYCVPTLEELIEACEEKFGFECLTKEPTGETFKRVLPVGNNPFYGKSPETIYKWKATAYKFKSGTWFEGSTPTEAVANLWLALNPKPL